MEYQSTLLAIALRRIAHEAPSRYLHFVSQSDLRVSRAAMAILPHSGGEPVTWLQSLIVSYAEARTLLLAEFLSPFNNRGASVNQEALRQSLFHAMEFKTMQSDALEAGVPIDLGVLTKDFESALLDLAERFPDDALVWLREVLRGPKREQLDPNGAGQSYAKQVFGDIARFRIAQRLQQILVDQGVSEALEIEVSSPHRGPEIPSIKEALALAEQLTEDSDSEEVQKIFEAIVPESEESLRQSPSHVGPSFMIRIAIALHALDRYELRGHLDEEVQAFAVDSKSLLFSPFHPTTLKASEVVILNAAQNKKVQKAIMQQFLRLVMDAEAAKPNFLAEADWFYDFGYPLKIREWFEAGDKDLQRFRRLIEG
ncbi:MAG: hypothetical protein KDB07_12535, partial [Planctomycetes bacterium]|nr:hypothetical protein [Planctomycetota bacterium]